MGVQKVRMPTGIRVVNISFRRIYLYENINDFGKSDWRLFTLYSGKNCIYILFMFTNFERG